MLKTSIYFYKFVILSFLTIFTSMSSTNFKHNYFPFDNNQVVNAIYVEKLGKLNANDIDSSFNAINNLIMNKIEKYTSYQQYIPIRNTLLEDFNGNIFVLAEFYPAGYGIYNVSNGDIVEVSSSSNSPYFSLSSGSELYYVPMVGYYKKVNNSYLEINNNKLVTRSILNELKSISLSLQNNAKKHINLANVNIVEKGIDTHDTNFNDIKQSNLTNIDELYQSADVEVPYSWYFKMNHSSYPENIDGTCGYTSLSLILGYTEIFKSAGYFSEEEASNYIIPFEGPLRTGVPTITNDFLNVFGDNLGSSVPSDLTSATNLFMEDKDKEYEIYEYLWRFSTITDPIKDGVPAAYFGNYSDTILDRGNHVTTVYGFDNDGILLLHAGYYNEAGDSNNFTNIKISRLGFFKEGGVFALYNKSPHVHSNYFHIGGNMKLCPCGVLVEWWLRGIDYERFKKMEEINNLNNYI